MSLRDWWKGRGRDPDVEPLQTRGMDGFADDILLELKAISQAAIARALEERESRYMRSILEESFFWLDGLVIKALDAQTARDMEHFLANHESIHADFRARFFAQVLQREYRSSRGATVRVEAGLVPTVELDLKALETPTQEEDFLISLKGRKVRFEAQARLTGPHSRASSPSAPAAAPPAGEAARAAPGPATVPSPGAPGAHRVRVSLRDRGGQREQIAALPLVLGREAVQTARQEGQAHAALDVDATYVSRRQLIVFELLGQVYCTVPAEASLTCSCQGQGLQPLRLMALHPGQRMELLTGLPVDAPEQPMDRTDPRDYALIGLEWLGPGTPHEGATPRPRAAA